MFSDLKPNICTKNVKKNELYALVLHLEAYLEDFKYEAWPYISGAIIFYTNIMTYVHMFTMK